MYKLCKTEQSSARQRKLERGLLEAMLSQHYDEISVSDLCDSMGIPRKSFYRYFSGKDGALYALIDHTILEYEGWFSQGNGREAKNCKKEMEQFFRFWKEHRILLDALYRSNLTGALVQRVLGHATADMGLSGRMLMQDNRTVTEHAITFAVCGLMSLLLKWHESGFDMTSSQIAAISVELLTKPLFAPETSL